MSQDTLERKDLDVGLLEENPDNPNEMSARAFDLLVDNIQKTGLTEAIVVRPVGDKYRIVSGHHRFKAALYLGYENVPCVVITDPEFDDEAERFQLVRMNVIKGKMDPQAFYDLYQQVAGKYGDELLQDMFGFSDENEFKRLVTATAKGLPKDMQEKFKKAAKEVKTIDGLAAILNELFTTYGDTVPYGFMVVDYGNQRHIWLRMTKKSYKSLRLIGDLCLETGVVMDDLLGELLIRVAKGDASELMESILDKAPKVTMPAGMEVLPTANHIEQVEQLDEE